MITRRTVDEQRSPDESMSSGVSVSIGLADLKTDDCRLFPMPELPEVETIARGLASRVTGDIIESVWLGSKPEPLKSPAAEIVATLESRRIAGVRRVGKHIVFDLEPAGGVGRTPSPAKRRNRTRGPSSRKKAAQGCPPHTISPMDRSSGYDRAHAGLPAGRRNAKAHPSGGEAGVGQGTALCRSAALRPVEHARRASKPRDPSRSRSRRTILSASSMDEKRPSRARC